MVLHLIKLAVGVDDPSQMKGLQAARRKIRRQSPNSPHWVYTRNCPRRPEELLAGGSLYWVVRGVIRMRQQLVGFEEAYDDDSGKKYCMIKVKRRLMPTAPKVCKAFQGWRYLNPANAPPDLSSGDSADMSPEMAADLKRLGLL